uniref:ShKT domain-containing protein n=1 Tax=Syphacia muris TaxID=451379 RepID=A0A0N5AC87_9BILA
MSHNSALVFTVCALQFVAVLSEDATTSSTAAATGPCKNELATEFCELIGKKRACESDGLKKYCLNYCNACDTDENYNCKDTDKNIADSTQVECEALKTLKFCEEKELQSALSISCPRTCGLCLYNGSPTCRNKLDATTCKTLVQFCDKSTSLGERVREQCAFTCNACQSTATVATTQLVKPSTTRSPSRPGL